MNFRLGLGKFKRKKIGDASPHPEETCAKVRLANGLQS